MLEDMQTKIGNVGGEAGILMLAAVDMLNRNWYLDLAYLYTKLSVDANNSGFNGTSSGRRAPRRFTQR